MNTSTFSSPEPLEQRIAPAGLVTVTFENGLLTIIGADGADHDVALVKTGASTFRLDGFATDIDILGQTSKSFRGALTGVHFEGGAGADTFEVSNLSPLKSFTFNGNAGVDTLSTSNLKTTAKGITAISLGSETGSVNFFGSATTLGSLEIDLGGGGTAGFRSAVTTVSGDANITGGLGADSLSITGMTTVFKKTLTFNGGEGNDSFNSSGKSLTVQGLVSMDGGAGGNNFVFGTDTNSFGKSLTGSGMVLNLGEGAGNVTFLGKSTKVLGDLKIDLGTGGGNAHLNSLVTTVRDHVQFTGGAGNDRVEFVGRTSIGKSLSFDGAAGDDALTASGELFSVKAATSMDGGVGASSFDLHPTILSLAALTVTGGTENDTVSIISDGIISGDANFQLGLDGTGPSSTILQSKAGLANGLKFGGALNIEMVGATVDVLTIANIQVAKAFTAQTGEGVSTVDVSKLNVLGNFKLQTGAGADVVNIDNVNSRDFYVDTQTGADELRIERNAAYVGASRVLGAATILTGIGADQIRIGNASDYANQMVMFMGPMMLDAGDGANMRNDILAANFFEFVPKILTTGGTLTQTEAV